MSSDEVVSPSGAAVLSQNKLVNKRSVSNVEVKVDNYDRRKRSKRKSKRSRTK